MPRTISATAARNNFSELLSQVLYHQEEFVIERKGKPIAVLIPKTTIAKGKKNLSKKLAAVLPKLSLGLKNWNQTKNVLKDLHNPNP